MSPEGPLNILAEEQRFIEQGLFPIKILKRKLDEFAAGSENIPLERSKIIQLLELFMSTFGPLVHVVRKYGEDDTDEYTQNHPAITFLEDFRDIIDDLNNSKQHPALKPLDNSKGRSLTNKQKLNNHVLAELVIVTQMIYKINKTKACEFLEKRLRKNNIKNPSGTLISKSYLRNRKIDKNYYRK